MSVRIKISPVFYRYTDGQKVTEVNGETVGECLNQMVERFSGIRRHLFNKNGQLFEYIILSVNGKNTYPNGLKTPVKDDDEISIMFIVGGG